MYSTEDFLLNQSELLSGRELSFAGEARETRQVVHVPLGPPDPVSRMDVPPAAGTAGAVPPAETMERRVKVQTNPLRQEGDSGSVRGDGDTAAQPRHQPPQGPHNIKNTSKDVPDSLRQDHYWTTEVSIFLRQKVKLRHLDCYMNSQLSTFIRISIL